MGGSTVGANQPHRLGSSVPAWPACWLVGRSVHQGGCCAAYRELGVPTVQGAEELLGERKGEKGREEEESGECVGVKVREDGGVL